MVAWPRVNKSDQIVDTSKSPNPQCNCQHGLLSIPGGLQWWSMDPLDCLKNAVLCTVNIWEGQHKTVDPRGCKLCSAVKWPEFKFNVSHFLST